MKLNTLLISPQTRGNALKSKKNVKIWFSIKISVILKIVESSQVY